MDRKLVVRPLLLLMGERIGGWVRRACFCFGPLFARRQRRKAIERSTYPSGMDFFSLLLHHRSRKTGDDIPVRWNARCALVLRQGSSGPPISLASITACKAPHVGGVLIPLPVLDPTSSRTKDEVGKLISDGGQRLPLRGPSGGTGRTLATVKMRKGRSDSSFQLARKGLG